MGGRGWGRAELTQRVAHTKRRVRHRGVSVTASCSCGPRKPCPCSPHLEQGGRDRMCGPLISPHSGWGLGPSLLCLLNTRAHAKGAACGRGQRSHTSEARARCCGCSRHDRHMRHTHARTHTDRDRHAHTQTETHKPRACLLAAFAPAPDTHARDPLGSEWHGSTGVACAMLGQALFRWRQASRVCEPDSAMVEPATGSARQRGINSMSSLPAVRSWRDPP